jgi:lantibiotic modifying enzyme
LKVLSDPGLYTRADAGVLYVRKRHASRAREAVAEVHKSLGAGLRPEIPLFTRRLASGLAIAEDPANASSFGQHRCKVIALALWRSFSQGDSSREARIGMVATVFKHEGLDPVHPDLGVHSALEDLAPVIPSLRVATALAPRAPVQSRLTTLDAAVRIGQTLCRAAYWDRAHRLCNWMGRSMSEANAVGQITPTSSALSPDLYHGSAGVALFLAQLYAITDDADCRTTALGAIARSVQQVTRRPTDFAYPVSFFCGWIGVAYVARRVAALTHDDELAAQADSLLDDLPEASDADHPLDLIGGNAGAVLALLAMGRPADRDRAVALGEEICAAATHDEGLWSWDPNVATGPGTGSVPLTGLSHGAAGIGLALLELHAVTGRPDFQIAGRGAFAYEDALFDTTRGNWPDLRGPVVDGIPRYTRAWCHGAPGIALARLRSAIVDPVRAQEHRGMARIATNTTLQTIEQLLASPRCDVTLCHGLAGLMEVALIAGEHLDEPKWRERALEVASVLIERHAIAGDWPTGVATGGPNPGLMLGLAGIGYAFLRVHDPEHVPSVLLLTR